MIDFGTGLDASPHGGGGGGGRRRRRRRRRIWRCRDSLARRSLKMNTLLLTFMSYFVSYRVSFGMCQPAPRVVYRIPALLGTNVVVPL